MRIVVLILIVSVGTACGGGGGGTDDDVSGSAPTPVFQSAALRVTFPPGGSTTDAAATMVCGRVSGGPVDAVFVNGHPAQSSDGYRTWVCEVPLDPGFNDIAIECVEPDGDRIAEAGPRVYRGVVDLVAPTDAAAFSGGIAVLDLKSDTVLTFDIESGAGRLVSGAGVGGGVDFVEPRFLTVSPDETTAVVFDAEQSRVVSVNMATGARMIASILTRGAGQRITGIATDGVHAYFPIGRTMIRVDLRSGVREPLWEAHRPCSQNGVGVLSGFALDRGTGRFIVVDGLANQLWMVTNDGVHDLVSPATKGAAFSQSGLVALTDRGSAVVDGGHSMLIEVDLRSGARRLITLDPGAVLEPTSLSWHDGRLLVAEASRGLVHRVDLASGSVETVLSAAPVIALAPAVGAVDSGSLVVDTSNSTVVEVDYETGLPTIVAEIPRGVVDGTFPAIDRDEQSGQALLLNPGTGLILVDVEDGSATVLDGGSAHQPAALRVDETNNRGIVLDTFASTGSIVSIDLESGEHEILVPAPAGPRVFEFGHTGGLALHPDGDTAFVARPDAVLESVDLVRGTRNPVPVVGPSLSRPTDAAYDPTGRCVLVLDEGRRGIIAVDPTSGESRIVSGIGHGMGPAFEAPRSIAVDPTRNIAHVVDGNRMLAVELETGARVITVR